MLPQLTQETLNEYAHDAQTTQQPYGADYTQGARVGKTIPAKWWNWLFNAVTKRIFQSKYDAQDMLTEMKNVVTDAGLTPDAADNTQLTQAITTKTNTQIATYIERMKRGFFYKWDLKNYTPFEDGHMSIIALTQDVHGVSATAMVMTSGPYNVDSWRLKVNTPTGQTVDLLPYPISGQVCQTLVSRLTIYYFKGVWFCILTYTFTPIGSSTAVARGHIFSSKDGERWSDNVRSALLQISGASNIAGICAFLKDDAFYICYGNAVAKTYNGIDFITATDVPIGSTFSQNFNDSAQMSYNNVIEAIPFAQGYVIGGAYVNSSVGTMWCTSPSYKLASGNVIMIGVDCNLHWQHSTELYTYRTPDDPETEKHVAGVPSDVSQYYEYRYAKVINGKFFFRQEVDGVLRYRYTEDGPTLYTLDVDVASYDSIFYNNGYYYVGTKRSIDLATWEDVPLPSVTYPKIYSLKATNVPGVLFYSPSTYNNYMHYDTYVSLDGGQHWVIPDYSLLSPSESEARTKLGFITNMAIFDSVVEKSRFKSGSTGESTSGFFTAVTYVGVNRVIGHTLYLR